MKIISKLLYLIIGLLMAICLYIALCAKDPSIAKFGAGLASEIAAMKEVPAEEAPQTPASTTASTTAE
ncbi:hypothetical protein [Butyrivibrio sp. MC2021]|uniref:hypothetical protein n=1 Tax=Butyrivibrio sp. MC2021 TaxID=1408306 RepID=UPI0012DCBC02|nr:hypothetical protein [Butyrivibrio sp. MC2021]